MAELVEANDSGLKGTITFEVKGKRAWVKGSIVKDPFKRRVEHGKHGFHIHKFGAPKLTPVKAVATAAAVRCALTLMSSERVDALDEHLGQEAEQRGEFLRRTRGLWWPAHWDTVPHVYVLLDALYAGGRRQVQSHPPSQEDPLSCVIRCVGRHPHGTARSRN